MKNNEAASTTKERGNERAVNESGEGPTQKASVTDARHFAIAVPAIIGTTNAATADATTLTTAISKTDVVIATAAVATADVATATIKRL